MALAREKADRLLRLLPFEEWEKVADRPDEGPFPPSKKIIRVHIHLQRQRAFGLHVLQP
jgi:hypothetical protein